MGYFRKPLESVELDRVMEACNIALHLDKCKSKMYAFVESRMAFIAPNLSILVGAPVAAKLMGVAGGLSAMAKMPFFWKIVKWKIFHSPIVQDTPPDLRRKAARLVASKCALAVKVDAFHEHGDGSIGRSLREEVERKLDGLQRRMKERYALTEMRKQQNRMTFGQIEQDAYQEDLGYTRGIMGKGAPGRIRGPTVDEKTKVRISQTLQRNLQRQQAYGGTTTIKRQVAGTASSVTFTPLQGLEIVAAQAVEKKADIVRYFSKYFVRTGTFINVNAPAPGPSSSKE